jgi:hypothetical protein
MICSIPFLGCISPAGDEPSPLRFLGRTKMVLIPRPFHRALLMPVTRVDSTLMNISADDKSHRARLNPSQRAASRSLPTPP